MVRQTLVIASCIFVTACSTSRHKDVSGFSGYGFGSEYEYILYDMRSEGRVPEESSARVQWYAGALDGYPVEFAYVFENGVLVSGMWVFQDTSPASFQSIENLLLRTYSGSVIIATEDDVNVHEHAGPDARIVHLLDTSEPRHAVHYHYAETVGDQTSQR